MKTKKNILILLLMMNLVPPITSPTNQQICGTVAKLQPSKFNNIVFFYH